MMRQDHPLGYSDEPGSKVLQMNYVGQELSMVLLLPDAPNGLPALERRLSSGALPDVWRNLRPYQVDVSMPRFEFENAFDLKKPLQDMGMMDAFDPRRADLSGISKEPGLHLGLVRQKAFILVDEEGTEAAAATSGSVVGCGVAAQYPPAVFRADHPFLFLILDRRSGCILVMGRVTDPR
jgi:serine protease inhibitor